MKKTMALKLALLLIILGCVPVIAYSQGMLSPGNLFIATHHHKQDLLDLYDILVSTKIDTSFVSHTLPIAPYEHTIETIISQARLKRKVVMTSA